MVATQASTWSGDAAIAIVLKRMLQSFYDFTGHSKTGTGQNENSKKKITDDIDYYWIGSIDALLELLAPIPLK